MPEFWMPAWVRVEARTREEAIEALTEVWANDDDEMPCVPGVGVRVMCDDSKLEEGALLDDEEAQEERAHVWGFAPPLGPLRG